MRKFKLAFLALAAVSGIAAAATQGTLGATSTGSFTNTFNSNPRQVQVLGLQDALVTPNSGNAYTKYGFLPGAQDQYCVVDTGGGSVKLTFTSANGKGSSSAGNGLLAKAADGSTLEYVLSTGVQGDANSVVDTSLDTTGLTVPAASTVTAASSCGAGALMKSIVVQGGAALPVGTKIYTDTVTVVATPI
ncbi:hypothetical protein [Pseudacidovorax intermedius]|uniref:hypothetical protein n=1 Tax=Pseudacidovorax intermedius TaxID=433924 RepID=UPI00128F3A34|nr:hypothetical protein [Pseudacidovorax intermedius]